MAVRPSQKLPTVDKLVEAPIIYFDDIASVGVRGGVLNATLAVHVGELTSTSQSTDHIVAVANLRFTPATAGKLRDLLDKALLATAGGPTAGRSGRKPN